MPTVLSLKIERSQLSDGTVQFVASVDELPGIVAIGVTPETARSELVALLENIRQRAGSPAVGLRTDDVPYWNWSIYSDGRLMGVFGPIGAAPQASGVKLPEGFRELQPIAG